MNRRKFVKLFGGLLAALPFMKKWFVSEHPPEQTNRIDNADIISYDTYADDGYIVFFNMADKQIAEAKAEWQNTKTITKIVYPVAPETAERFQGSTLRIWAE